MLLLFFKPRYNQKINGVVLAYEKVALRHGQAICPDDMGVLGFTADTTLTVFCPAPGDIIRLLFLEI